MALTPSEKDKELLADHRQDYPGIADDWDQRIERRKKKRKFQLIRRCTLTAAAASVVLFSAVSVARMGTGNTKIILQNAAENVLAQAKDTDEHTGKTSLKRDLIADSRVDSEADSDQEAVPGETEAAASDSGAEKARATTAPAARATAKPTESVTPKPTAKAAPKPAATPAPKAASKPAAVPTPSVKPVPTPKVAADVPADEIIKIPTAMGEMQYFNQHDSHWKYYLWGGADQITSYGCGPTALAMIANAFGNSKDPVTPITMADWAAGNGQFAMHGGSNHSIVETALTAYGFQVNSLQGRMNADTVRAELKSGKILVALMGKGYFTRRGHFILITAINPDNSVRVADPNSKDNTMKTFSAEFLVSELMKGVSDGGSPLWAVAKAPR